MDEWLEVREFPWWCAHQWRMVWFGIVWQRDQNVFPSLCHLTGGGQKYNNAKPSLRLGHGTARHVTLTLELSSGDAVRENENYCT